MGASHVFPTILPDIMLWTYTVKYVPDISLKFQEIKRTSLISENKKKCFSSRISFNIRLWTYTVRYISGIKNTQFSLNF
jgi:hypothetical protein